MPPPTGEIYTGGGGEVSGYENKGIFKSIVTVIKSLAKTLQVVFLIYRLVFTNDLLTIDCFF